MSKLSYVFPPNFVWGVAAASAQIEGAAHEDGKGESIWDRYSRIPGNVINGDTPEVACDHYHRYENDARLIGRDMGLKHYRLSIAWPRILPDGTGAINEKGLDFYDRLIDALLAEGVTPWVTLFHWDLPQKLEDKDGWLNRDTVTAFRHYCDLVTKRLGDRVQNWFTLNEIDCFIGLGYRDGSHAPFRKESAKLVNAGYHHALLAHGHAVQSIRAHVPNARIGLAHNPWTIVPVTENEGDIEAARAHYHATNGHLLNPLYKGEYDPKMLEKWGDDAPTVLDGDMELITSPTDFLGLNIYSGSFVRRGPDGKPQNVGFPPQYPTGDLPWIKIINSALYWGVRHVQEIYGEKSFYITENGAAFDDMVTDDGEILDLDRRELVRSYLIGLHRAIEEGIDVQGYFLWSLMDNYEWAEGYVKRFGIVRVDYPTQKRTLKLSAHWYREVAQNNRLV